MFVATAVLLPPSSPDDSSWRFVCVVFFGLGMLVSICLLVRPQTLTLDSDGFTLSGGLSRKAKKISWRNMDPFFIYQLPRGGKMIGFNLKPEVKKTVLVSVNHFFGADGALPRLWPGAPDDKVDELNAYRANALLNQ